MKKIGFDAAIIELKVKRLVSQDKSMRLILEVDQPADELIDSLNRLFKADTSVGVAIAGRGK
ncbi:MAG: hypothetical protein NTV82_03060 [Candidatus Aminicenantes bacterium]|nr:hypothetical protein [Candidatus Aminicenantes bacterium]